MKKIRICLIIMICVLVILLILLGVLKKVQNDSEVKQYLYPKNLMDLQFEYKGEVNLTDVYAELYNIVNKDIPKVNSKLSKLKSDKKIEKYYKKNEYVNYKIENVSDFKQLVNILKGIDVDNLELEYAEILDDSCIISKTGAEFGLKIKYKNCNDIILKIKVLNKEQNNSHIKYIPIVEE